MAVVRALGKTRPVIESSAFLAETAVVVGDVHVGECASIWYGAVLRGDVGTIRVGARSNIQDNACIHMTHGVSNAEIGDNVIVGHGAVIHGAVVESHALVGISAVLMDNARIGEGAWVAAGSVVPPGMIVPPGMLVRGSPAREIRPVKEEETRWAQEAIQRYLGLAERHALSVSADSSPASEV